MTTLPDLEPCPFCGGSDIRTGYDIKRESEQIWCDDCDCMFESTTAHQAELVAAWNRRAARSTVPEAGKAAAWRSMDSAPRDGSKFLAYEKGHYFDCWWHQTDYGDAYWMDEADSEPNPSHWCRLPAAPLLEDTHHGR